MKEGEREFRKKNGMFSWTRCARIIQHAVSKVAGGFKRCARSVGPVQVDAV